MSEETGPLAQQAAASTAVADGPVDHDHVMHQSHGLSDMGYVRVAIGLGVITALEVAWSYLSVWDNATGGKHVVEVAGLLIMMSIKFSVVASNFMHLKFDDKVLTRIFYFGLFLAVGVYMVALTTFHVFW
jgi:cytochrome c oxidase subunit 4